MNEAQVEMHPLEPFYPEKARLLMLGSFPPQVKRWSMSFYYPNYQNDMWRIFGMIFFKDRNYFLQTDAKAFDEHRIRTFLQEKGIALSDTVRKAVRLKENASDRFLEVEEPIDIMSVFKRLPQLEAVATTGQKATDILTSLLGVESPAIGKYVTFEAVGANKRFYRMPSSSRAYPRPIEEKAAAYGQMMEEIGMIKIETE